MAWGWNEITDEQADEAFDAYAQEGFEPGFNMDDGADPEGERGANFAVSKD